MPPRRRGVPVEGELSASTRSKLGAVGRLDEPESVAALQLAAALDAGGHSGSQMAAMVREFRATLDAALRGAPRVEDALDELQARRRRRLGG